MDPPCLKKKKRFMIANGTRSIMIIPPEWQTSEFFCDDNLWFTCLQIQEFAETAFTPFGVYLPAVFSSTGNSFYKIDIPLPVRASLPRANSTNISSNFFFFTRNKDPDGFSENKISQCEVSSSHALEITGRKGQKRKAVTRLKY